jgi:EthD domain
VFGMIPKNPALTDDQFHDHWLNHHGAIASRIGAFRRYIQSHRIEPPLTALEGLSPPFKPSSEHGVAEVWFDDFASLMGMANDPAYPELAADETYMVDLNGRAFRALMSEHVVRDGSFGSDGRGVKLLVFLRRRADLDPAGFAAAWPAADDGQVSLALGCSRHVACVGVAENYGLEQPSGGGGHGWTAEDPYDGVLELWWPSQEAMVASLAANPEALSTLTSAADAGRSMSFAAREHVMIA